MDFFSILIFIVFFMWGYNTKKIKEEKKEIKNNKKAEIIKKEEDLEKLLTETLDD